MSILCSNSTRTRAARAIWPILPELEGLPALGEQREAAFAHAPHRPDQRIAGAGVNVEFFHSGGFLHRGEDAVTCAFVPAVGQGGHLAREQADHGEGLFPRRGEAIHVAGENVKDPHRLAVRVEQGLDITAEVLPLPRVPQVDFPPLAAEGFLMAPVGVDDLAVQDDVRSALGQGAFQGLAQSGAFPARTPMTSSRYR